MFFKGTKNGFEFVEFKPGKTYSYEGRFKNNLLGFRFFQDFDSIDLLFDLISKETVIFEIDVIERVEGKNIFSGDFFAKKIKIVREIPKSEWGNFSKRFVFDDRNNLIRENVINDYTVREDWRTYEYDSENKMIKAEDSNGFCWLYSYDSNGNLIKEEHLDRHWISYEYNNENKLIRKEMSDGRTEKYEYDSNMNLLKVFHSEDFEDSLNDCVGFSLVRECKYLNNILIKETYKDGFTTFEYDDLGRTIAKYSSDGSFEKWEYSDDQVKFENSNGEYFIVTIKENQ